MLRLRTDKLAHARFVAQDERAQIRAELDALRASAPDAVRAGDAEEALLGGVAAHHAGMLPAWRSLVERLVSRNLVKLVFCTETLAAGINMPVRTAVLSALSKRTAGGGHGPLAVTSLFQMAGRAGRRGFDDRGYVVVVQSAFEGAAEAARLLFAPVEPLVSQFSVSYGMVLGLLRAGRSLAEAREILQLSFANYQGSAREREREKALRELEGMAERLRAAADAAAAEATAALAPAEGPKRPSETLDAVDEGVEGGAAEREEGDAEQEQEEEGEADEEEEEDEEEDAEDAEEAGDLMGGEGAGRSPAGSEGTEDRRLAKKRHQLGKRARRKAARAARAEQKLAKLRRQMAASSAYHDGSSSAAAASWRAFELLLGVLVDYGAVARDAGGEPTLLPLGTAAVRLFICPENLCWL